VLLVYEGHEGEQPVAPVAEAADLRLWHYRLGHSRETLPRPAGQEKTVTFTLSGGMMGSDAWTINGKQYPRTAPLHLQQGERVRVQLHNHSMEAHPMHLHGQSFQVLAINGQPLAQPLVKDSVDVEAHMGAVEIAFTATNPGDWLFHCHKPMHMEGGMITLVSIA
jgi:FtsP/CotA-like multicopper oxidase with cupredoxin domain